MPGSPTNPDKGPQSSGSIPPRADAGGADPLLEILYDHLRAIAQQRMRAEGVGHSLQATALVHEAYLRIGQDRRVEFKIVKTADGPTGVELGCKNALAKGVKPDPL